MQVRQNIRRLRHNAGLTQRELAERIGVTPSTVTQWELGMSAPRMQRIDAIAEALGVATGEVLGDSLRADGLDYVPVATVPFMMRAGVGSDRLMGSRVEVPASLMARCPDAWAVNITDDAMDRVLPVGMIAICNPDQVPANGQLAVVSIDGASPIIRRWYRGGNTTLLVADSHASHDDIVVREDTSLEVLGTVVWIQSADLLA